MVGGLVLSQAQSHQIATPRTAAPAPGPGPVLEKRPREQAAPCGKAVSARSVDEVRKAHARHIKLGLDRSPRHARPLLAACALSGWPGGMELAASIFDSLDEPEAFDYNTLMRGHVISGGRGDPAAALMLHVDMLEAGVAPDSYTFPFVLKACAQLAALQQGRQLQAHVVKLGFHHDEHVQNSLISLYGKCGEPAAARLAFDGTAAGGRTAASWSALLAAYTRAGMWSECLASFGAMARGGARRPDESSMVSALSACAHLGAHDAGRSIHCALLRNAAGLNTIMGTALVDMYAKCGRIDKAAAVFGAMGDRNAWAYSAMVSGLAMHGDAREALRVFEEMLREGHAPDAAVYVGVLNACSRAGLLDDGLRCFDRMRLEHKVSPNAQHYGCMVDMLARAGRLDEARALIGSMPPTGQPTDTAWRSLLNACRIHGDLDLAERALQELRRLGAANAGDYVIVAGMHARAKEWDAAAALRTEAADAGLAQAPGFSAVEVRGEVHRFVSQDMSHPRSRDIYEMLHQMEWQLRFEGYEPDTSELALDAGEEEKRRVVAAHSQKLAMAFGLLSTPEGAPVRVVTNLRMSKECHAYSALISEIFGREIVVRDRNRFHRFRSGACTCRDYW
ncbi:unnamed protein product [Urochloa decumbens]|uniref:DYW domain-containing protein n=1 Tax=Urochloa decumbens TaxID=240449 RepID=A0ABC9ECY7_9POAL